MKNLRVLLPVLFFTLSPIFSTFAFALDTEDQLTIKALIQGYTAAWNAEDGNKFASGFTDDADFVNIYGMHISKKDEIAARHQLIITSFLKGSKLEILNTQMREVKVGTVIAHVRWKLDGYREPSSGSDFLGETREGIFTQVFIKEYGKWFITASHNTLMPKRK